MCFEAPNWVQSFLSFSSINLYFFRAKSLKPAKLSRAVLFQVSDFTWNSQC